tara:strand:- start:208 stop:450 length:243 start_codon:yes stop_codon:yes gene_type:complete
MIKKAPPVLRFERIVKILRGLFVDSDLEIRLGTAFHEGADNAGPWIWLGFVDKQIFFFAGLGEELLKESVLSISQRLPVF